MAGIPRQRDCKLMEAPNDYAASTVAYVKIQWNAASGFVPLQGDDLTQAAAKKLRLVVQADLRIGQQSASGTYGPALPKGQIDLGNTHNQPDIAAITQVDAAAQRWQPRNETQAAIMDGSIFSAGWQNELAVEDSHWRHYLGPQYRNFRDLQFE